MNIALQKTLGMLLLILIGLFLQKKIISKEGLSGTKVLILSVALPATIFVALLKIQLNISLIILPVLALAFNLIMFGASKLSLVFFDVPANSNTKRTLMMLLPSLAPGLSCFPFIMEFLGEEELAMAALADVGNKIFVLIILYIVAVHWYHKLIHQKNSDKGESKIKGLLLSMLQEPINMVIIVALIMLVFGFSLQSFPGFLESSILRMSAIMTPLVLLFIGMAVKIKKKEFYLVFTLLLWRSGLAFLLSAIAIFMIPAITPALALLVIVFPQSSVSFWPYAHMTAVGKLEEKEGTSSHTFNTEFGLAVLACSLPFSTILILGVFNFQKFFINPVYLLLAGIILIATSFLPKLTRQVRLWRFSVGEEKLG